MAFPTTSVLTSFTGTDEDPLSEGGNWTTGASVAITGLGISGNQTRTSNQAGARSGIAMYDIAQYGGPCEVFTTLSVLPTNGAGATYVFARISALTTTPNGYSLDWRLTGGVPTMRLLRYDAGVTSDVVSSWTQALSVGDKIGLELNGSTLTPYVFTGGSWITTGSPGTDATYGAAGYIGFGITDVNARVDDFGGGTIVSASTDMFLPISRRGC